MSLSKSTEQRRTQYQQQHQADANAGGRQMNRTVGPTLELINNGHENFSGCLLACRR